MKPILGLLLVASLLPGCRREVPLAGPPAAAPTAAVCRVCEVDQGGGHPEYLPSRLDVVVSGQKYQFCADRCRQTFDRQRARYLRR
ncbi:MAG: hypothetical protein IT204_03590 [Fimbriimonadaceae bacterium]|nr:hypothetical protein [Fimbriimonadaceae bacterium]